MAKIAVQLLNCQSEAEARPVYPCTLDMVRFGLFLFWCYNKDIIQVTRYSMDALRG